MPSSSVDELRRRAERWLAKDPDPQTRAQLDTLLDNPTTLAQHFEGQLRFGTAGLRAPLGPGPRRLNTLQAIHCALGLARCLEAPRRIVIGFDARAGSDRFANAAAGVLMASGIEVHLFVRPDPTPLLAFALRHLEADAGLMFTASHNPKEDNGIKVFGPEGAQIVAPLDQRIEQAMAGLEAEDLPNIDSDARPVPIDETLEAAYRQTWPKPQNRAALRVAYTALHGVAGRWAEQVFDATSEGVLEVVETQHLPDGSFPTAPEPNPELPQTLSMVHALAASADCELILAHDPDGDRLAVGQRIDGRITQFNGNQIGVLLATETLRGGGEDACVATTVVSSRLLAKLAEARGAQYIESLTGFKHIMQAVERGLQPQRRLKLAYEEALGFCMGEAVRDKDGISAMAALLAMAARLKEQGQSLLDAYEAIESRLGYHRSEQRSIKTDLEGRDQLMRRAREPWPKNLVGQELLGVTDYAEHSQSHMQANLVIADFESARIAMRPSGTEPKVKCYYEVWQHDAAPDQGLAQLVEAHQRQLNAAPT